MRNEFLGKLCPVCKVRFNENDDVVVCPVCGTPHHRECYVKENRCGLEELHAKGFTWKGIIPGEEVPPPLPVKNIQNETDPNAAGRIEAEPTPEDMERAVYEMLSRVEDPAKGADGVSMRELCAFVSTSLLHYAHAFTVIRGGSGIKKRKVYFNISSGLLAPMFQFYRKMDVFGLIIIAIMLFPILLLSINENFFRIYPMLGNLFSLINIVGPVLLCFFGDYIYYHHAVRKITKIREHFKGNENSQEYYAALEQAGRPSFLRAIIGILVMVLANNLILKM